MDEAISYYKLGLDFQKAGSFSEALKCFEKSIKLNKNLPQPLNAIGLLYLNKGKYQKASGYFRSAIKINPKDFAAYNNLGNACNKMGKEDKSIECYKKVIGIAPYYPQPYNNLGFIYFQKREYQKSYQYLKKAVEVDPNYFMAYFHLALVQRKLCLFTDAKKSIAKHLKFKPDHAESHRILGVCLLEEGHISEAEKSLNYALSLDANNAHIYNDLGNLFRKDADYLKSMKYYNKALKIDFQLAGVHSNLGSVLNNLGKVRQAEKELKYAIKIDPKCVEAYCNLAVVYEKTKRLHSAGLSYEKAYRIDPNITDSLVALVPTLMLECDWEKLKKYNLLLDALTKKEIKEGKTVSQPALLNVARKMDEKENFEVAESWSRSFKNITLGAGVKFDFSKRKRNKRIKIGYLSCDFYNHATAQLTLGMYVLHDRRQFEVFVYSYGPDDKSPYRNKIISDSDNFVDIALIGNAKAAQKIYDDGIDILVDLKGHTRDARPEISAAQPSPLQIAWLGFPGTSGAGYFDYIIADKIVLPIASIKNYSEKPIYLPCYQINDDKQPISGSYSRKDFKLPENTFVFSSFHSTYKIDSQTFDSWMEILKRVPNSVLWILSENSYAQVNLKKEAKKRGVNPERIIFTNNLQKNKHLARIKLCDLALDTFIYNGHTTTSDCLWAGVPVVTLKGSHFASRVSASLLSAVGLPELITHTPKEYENLAVTLAKSPNKLESLKDKLQKNRIKSSLFNTKLFVDNLENAYLSIWENYLSKIH